MVDMFGTPYTEKLQSWSAIGYLIMKPPEKR